MEEVKFKVGDIIKSTETVEGEFANRYGRIDEILTVYTVTEFAKINKILVTFEVNGEKFQIALPDDAYENPEKYFEVVFHWDGLLFPTSAEKGGDDSIPDWVLQAKKDWDENSEEKPLVNDIVSTLKDGDTKFDAANEKLNNEIDTVLNPEYNSPEDAAEDIFNDVTEKRLKALREKYRIPEVDEKAKEIIKEQSENA